MAGKNPEDVEDTLAHVTEATEPRRLRTRRSYDCLSGEEESHPTTSSSDL